MADLQTINTFGYELKRLLTNTLFAPPDSTPAIPAELQSYPWFAIKDGDLWRWNTTTFVWEEAGGGADTNFAEDDLTFTGNRTHNLDGNNLRIEQGGEIFLLLDTTLGNETSLLRAFNSTGGDNIAQIGAFTTNSDAIFDIDCGFNGNAQRARIIGTSNVTDSDIIYTADIHTFEGDLIADNIQLQGATSGEVIIASDTLSNVATGTNLSGIGHIPFIQSIIVRSDETLVNSNLDQNLFAASHDQITVQANTTYEFYITGDFTHGAVSHSIALGFVPTTALVTRIEYNSYSWVTAVGTATASQVSTRVKSTATTAINLAGANATESFEARGTITIGGTGGIITPTIRFSADPTGTILLKEGARMNIWPIGNDTFIVQGNIS